MEQAVSDEFYLIARRRHEISGLTYEISSKGFQLEQWKGLGGDEAGFTAAYDLLVEDYGGTDRMGMQKSLGMNGSQWHLFEELRAHMQDLVNEVGYNRNNTVYISCEKWPVIMRQARELFVALNASGISSGIRLP